MSDAAIRARLLAEVESLGVEALHARLASLDPPTAARLAPRDRQRVTRALEVQEASGKPLSWWHAQQTRAGLVADWRVVEIEMAPAELDGRIARRTRAMFAAGLLEETRALVEAGKRDALVALKAIGYDEALAILEGRMTAEEGEGVMNHRTRSMAKRQRTWFRHQLEARRVGGSGAPEAVFAAAREALGLGRDC